MMDYISRNGARLALAKMRSDYDFDYNAIIDKCINRISQLPIYRQEQKVGKWQITDAYPHNVYCSECHKRFAQTQWEVWEDGSLPRNYCPNCGAKMEGADEVAI